MPAGLVSFPKIEVPHGIGEVRVGAGLDEGLGQRGEAEVAIAQEDLVGALLARPNQRRSRQWLVRPRISCHEVGAGDSPG